MPNKKYACMCVQHEVKGWDQEEDMVLPVDTDTYQLRITCPDHVLPELEEIPKLVKQRVPGIVSCLAEPVTEPSGYTEIRMLVKNTRKHTYTNYVLAIQERLLCGQIERRFFTPFYLDDKNEVVPILDGKWSDETSPAETSPALH